MKQAPCCCFFLFASCLHVIACGVLAVRKALPFHFVTHTHTHTCARMHTTHKCTSRDVEHQHFGWQFYSTFLSLCSSSHTVYYSTNFPQYTDDHSLSSPWRVVWDKATIAKAGTNRMDVELHLQHSKMQCIRTQSVHLLHLLLMCCTWYCQMSRDCWKGHNAPSMNFTQYTEGLWRSVTAGLF